MIEHDHPDTHDFPPSSLGLIRRIPLGTEWVCECGAIARLTRDLTHGALWLDETGTRIGRIY